MLLDERLFRELIYSIPQRFKKEKWNGKNISVSLRFSEPFKGNFGIVIENGNCFLNEDSLSEADCIVSCSGENYLKLELGEINAHWAVVSGKVKVSNLPLMMEFTAMFRRFKVGVTLAKKTDKPIRVQPEGPLTGVKVIDLSRLLPGPLASLWLAQLGAEVIKVEDADLPDPIRSFMPIENGQSVFYTLLNAGKKSVTLNLKSQNDQRKFRLLLEKADVLLEGFRPGVMKSFGLDYSSLKDNFKKLTYVSVSGYGQYTNMASKAGHDLNYQAMSGLLSLLSKEGVMPHYQAADIAGGTYAAIMATLTGIIKAKNSGKGFYADVSMTDAIKPLATLAFAHHQHNTNQAFELSGTMPNYRLYQTSDNRFMALAALEPKFWERFCAFSGKTNLLNIYTFSQEQLAEAHTELESYFITKPLDYWQVIGMEHDFCLTPVLTPQEVLQHSPSFEKLPFRIECMETPTLWPAPALGEDNYLLDYL